MIGLLRTAALGWLRVWHHFGPEGQILLILSHMRAGSHLLHHTLCSHPEILGTGERNHPIANKEDLDFLVRQVHYNQRRFIKRSTWSLDIINHEHLFQDEAIFNLPRLQFVILLREPVGALSSMVSFLSKHYNMTLEQAVDYYTKRLHGLPKYAEAIANENCPLFLTYQQLTSETDATLSALGKHLSLNNPISGDISNLKVRGAKHSHHLDGGKIKSGITYEQGLLSEELITEMAELYGNACEKLKRLCKTV